MARKGVKRHPPLPATKHVKAHEVMETFARKMKSGMSSTDAYNETLEELGGPPSGAFGGEARQEISHLIHNTPQGKATIRSHEAGSKWEVKSLDVWGNEEDGFEVNQEFHAGEVEIPSMVDDKELLKIMKKGGFIKDNVKSSQVEFEDTGGGFIEMKNAKTGEPLYFLYGES